MPFPCGNCPRGHGMGGCGGTFCPAEGGAIRAKVCAGTGILEPRGHFLPRRRGGNQGQSVCRNGDPGAAGALFAPQKGGQSGPKCVQERGSWSRGALFAPQKGGGQSGPRCVQERGSWSRGALFAPQKGGAIRAKVCAGTDTMSVAATWRFWNGCGLVQKTIIPLHHAPALREPDWRRPATFLFEESPNHTNYISTIVHVNSCSTQAL